MEKAGAWRSSLANSGKTGIWTQVSLPGPRVILCPWYVTLTFLTISNSKILCSEPTFLWHLQKSYSKIAVPKHYLSVVSKWGEFVSFPRCLARTAHGNAASPPWLGVLKKGRSSEEPKGAEWKSKGSPIRWLSSYLTESSIQPFTSFRIQTRLSSPQVLPSYFPPWYQNHLLPSCFFCLDCLSLGLHPFLFLQQLRTHLLTSSMASNSGLCKLFNELLN